MQTNICNSGLDFAPVNWFKAPPPPPPPLPLSSSTDLSKVVPLLQFFVHQWFRMLHLFCHYLFLISFSFAALGRLCFVIVAYPGYLRLYVSLIAHVRRTFSLDAAHIFSAAYKQVNNVKKKLIFTWLFDVFGFVILNSNIKWNIVALVIFSAIN